MITKKELIEEFTSNAEKGTAAFFIGAGISNAYNLPNFKELICELASGKIDLTIKDKDNFPEIAQYILNSYMGNKQPIIKKIQKIFRIAYDKSKSSYLSDIAKSNVRTIWTTNYDTLIEESLDDCDKDYECKNSDAEFQSEFENTEMVEVLKMHGDIYSSDIVITKEDYEDFTLTHELTIRRFEKDLMTKSFLFVGYSYRDPNIQSIVNHVRQLTKGKSKFRHFLIIKKEKNPQDIKLQKLWLEDLTRYQIYTYIINDYAELEEILSEISRKSKGKSVFVTGSHNKEDCALAEELGKKLAEIPDLVLNYGQSDGIGKTAINAFAQAYISKEKTLVDRIKVFPNPYAFCNEWDNKDFLLPQLKILRKELIEKTQVVVAFAGGKGTIAEIKAGLQQGSIIIPILNSDIFDATVSTFRKEIEKYPEIMDKIRAFDASLEEKIKNGTVEVDDIIRCIKSIIQ